MRPYLPFIVVLLLWMASVTGSSASAAEGDDKPAAIERLHRSGQSALAFQRVDKAIAAQPGDPALRFLRAVMMNDTGRYSEARTEYERLTQDFPELPEPFNNLAVLVAAQGRLDRARELLETALRNDPAYVTAQANLGDVLVRLAVRSYEAAASAVRDDAALQRKLRLARELVNDPSIRP